MPQPSIGDHSETAMFGASGTDGFIFFIHADCMALQAQAGAGSGSHVLCKENACYLYPLQKVGEKQPCFRDVSPHSSDPSLCDHSPAPLPVLDVSHCRHSPIRKSMYPSPPLSTRTFFSFCPSVSVVAVLGFSEGLSNTLPFKVARTFPGSGQRYR